MNTIPATHGSSVSHGSGASWIDRFAGSELPGVSLAIAAIWISVVTASLFAPVMVTGSNHEELSIVAMADWIWAGLATGLLLLAAGVSPRRVAGSWPMVGPVTAIVWAAVALVSIYAPAFVTGSDPTTIPLAAILAPIAGMTVTAFLSVFAAGARPGPGAP
jgi:hypothetical protein